MSNYYIDVYIMMGKTIHSVLIELAYYYFIIMTWYCLILDLTPLSQDLCQPTAMLINLILLFGLLLDHTLYTDMDNGVSTDDICQHKMECVYDIVIKIMSKWCHSIC